MKKLAVLLMAATVTLALASVSFALAKAAEPSAPWQVAQAAKAQAATTAKAHRLTGEVVSVDQAAKTMTLKYMVRKRSHEATFAVEDQAAPTLANLKPDDRVKVRYHKDQGRLIADSIVATSRKASR